MSATREQRADAFIKFDRLIKKADVAAFRTALASGENGNLTDVHGWSLLMAAAMKGNTAIGEALIEAGADVSYANGNATALTFAFSYGHVRFMELLLRCGVDPNVRGVEVESWMQTCQLAQTNKPQSTA